MPRKRKSAAILRLAAGDFAKAKAPEKKDQQIEVAKDIKVPATLNEQGPGAKKWREVAPVLQSLGRLTVADMQNLEAFCMAYETMLSAKIEIDNNGIIEQGMGGAKKNPAITAFKDAADVMYKYSNLLGLDPSSREKLTGSKSNKAKSFENLSK